MNPRCNEDAALAEYLLSFEPPDEDEDDEEDDEYELDEPDEMDVNGCWF